MDPKSHTHASADIHHLLTLGSAHHYPHDSLYISNHLPSISQSPRAYPTIPSQSSNLDLTPHAHLWNEGMCLESDQPIPLNLNHHQLGCLEHNPELVKLSAQESIIPHHQSHYDELWGIEKWRSELLSLSAYLPHPQAIHQTIEPTSTESDYLRRSSVSSISTNTSTQSPFGSIKTPKPIKEKKFACPSCEKRFARAFNLQTHIATHQGIRPFECLAPTCTKAFSRRHDLSRHLNAIHSHWLKACQLTSAQAVANLKPRTRDHLSSTPFKSSTSHSRLDPTISKRSTGSLQDDHRLFLDLHQDQDGFSRNPNLVWQATVWSQESLDQ